MDLPGNIYEGTKENPVKPEDAARLEGYLKAKAESTAEKTNKEKMAELERKIREEALDL